MQAALTRVTYCERYGPHYSGKENGSTVDREEWYPLQRAWQADTQSYHLFSEESNNKPFNSSFCSGSLFNRF